MAEYKAKNREYAKIVRRRHKERESATLLEIHSLLASSRERNNLMLRRLAEIDHLVDLRKKSIDIFLSARARDNFDNINADQWSSCMEDDVVLDAPSSLLTSGHSVGISAVVSYCRAFNELLVDHIVTGEHKITIELLPECTLFDSTSGTFQWMLRTEHNFPTSSADCMNVEQPILCRVTFAPGGAKFTSLEEVVDTGGLREQLRIFRDTKCKSSDDDDTFMF